MSLWNYFEHDLEFKKPAGTSRGVLKKKYSGYIYSYHENELHGIGEVSTIPGLSIDHQYDFKAHILESCDALANLNKYPALQFGVEMMDRSLLSKDPLKLFDNPFSRGEEGITINGLVWMGSKYEMISRVKEKLESGYQCIKLKIGAIDFEDELDILKLIRREFSSEKIEIRVDANGGFSNFEARIKLQRLSEFDIHSIEQPIAQGQWEEMAKVIYNSPIPIALDEELIGIDSTIKRNELIEIIKPNYIILKPSLLGGFSASEEWIAIANKNNIKWWITSALESNIGLNAIAQWTSSLNLTMKYQGLGTGQLYTNNIPSPLYIDNGSIYYGNEAWDLNSLGC